MPSQNDVLPTQVNESPMRAVSSNFFGPFFCLNQYVYGCSNGSLKPEVGRQNGVAISFDAILCLRGDESCRPSG